MLTNVVFAITYDNAGLGKPNCADQFLVPGALVEVPLGNAQFNFDSGFDENIPLSACGVFYQRFSLDQLGP